MNDGAALDHVLQRLDANLPEALNQRDFEQFAIDGGRAYRRWRRAAY